jgi:glutamyl-Q tRNA(Asp) synthetase
MSSMPIIGRFAPTPSGPLHFGSLVSALASYCQAKSQQGQWLIRIEDVDTPRVVEGSADQILNHLELFGFEWDGEIIYQSDQFERYEAAVQQLLEQGNAFNCQCSRRSLRQANARSGPLGLIYPGTCRTGELDQINHSVRINTEFAGLIDYIDLLLGQVKINIPEQIGDFVVRRADNIYAYHLAVVMDDELQGVNQVVRGADLLEATCLHLYLQQLLGFKPPEYLHVPLVRNDNGDKLSKQTGATALDISQVGILLVDALRVLGQPIEPGLERGSAREIVEQAAQSWDFRRIPVPECDLY